MYTDHIEDKAPLQEESKVPPAQTLLVGFRDHINRFRLWIQSLRIPIFIKLAALSISNCRSQWNGLHWSAEGSHIKKCRDQPQS